MPVRPFCALLLTATLGGCGAASPDAAPDNPLLQQRDRAQAQAAEMEQRKQQLDAAIEPRER